MDTLTDSFSGTALEGLRVIELGGERADYCGRLLAGAGADVIKVEPPGGCHTRSYGPFYRDEPGPNNSLYFWHYNLGKRGIELDLQGSSGRDAFMRLVATADIVLDGSLPGYLDGLGIGFDVLERSNPNAILCSITPFGQTGPWRNLESSDLVHLALGGQMMVCGYEPPPVDYDPANPGPAYDTPPIAPQMWHAYHTVGIQACNAIIGALLWREDGKPGQRIECSVHEALAGCTEAIMPGYIYSKQVYQRQTGRHAGRSIGTAWMFPTADGEYALAMSPNIGFPAGWFGFARMLADEGLGDELTDPKYNEMPARRTPETSTRVGEMTSAFALMHTSEEVMSKAQQAGLAWSAVRRPEENLADPHFQAREIFQRVEHPELGESFDYVAVPWFADGMPWRVGQRAPLLGEHTEEVLSSLGVASR